MNTGKYLDCFWIIRVEHISMTHGCQSCCHNPKPKQAGSRKENAELDTSGNIIHRVKQAYYYWRYTKLELADSTIISLRQWHRLTLSLLYLSFTLFLFCLLLLIVSSQATRRHSSHAQAAAGVCFCCDDAETSQTWQSSTDASLPIHPCR